MKSISLEFKGYKRSADVLPEKSGIYCVYRGIPHPEKSTVTLNELIYIGESSDIHYRVTNHDRMNDWKKTLESGEALRFTYCEVPSSDRVRAEAALIFKHKPRLNSEYTTSFTYEDTSITLTGETKFLNSSFTVKKTL